MIPTVPWATVDCGLLLQGRGNAYLAKVNLIKDDLIGMSNAPEPCNKRQNRYHAQRKLVIPI